MTYKLVVLSLSLMLLIFLAAYGTLPAGHLTVRSVDLLGPQQTEVLAASGRSALLRALAAAEFVAALPWLLIGAALSLTLRLALGLWQRVPPAPVSERVTDEAGVEFEMFGETFDHVPALSRMPLAPAIGLTLPHNATPLQRQAFAAVAAAPGIPADTQGAHGCSLVEHTARVYLKAVAIYGAPSLEADLAVLHDLGKLLAYVRQDGRWVALYPFHANLTLVVAGRLPAFWRLRPDQRARLASALTVLCTRQTPSDLDPALRKAINACRALDRGATSIEKALRGAPTAEGEVDFTQLCAALRKLPEELAEWNINGVVRSAAPVEGWWLPDDNALLLPAARVRAWLAQHVPASMARQLNLTQASTSTHSADAPIADALRNEGLLAEVVQSQHLKHGWWRIVIARQTGSFVAALRGDRIPDALKSRWGKPRKEITLEPV